MSEFMLRVINFCVTFVLVNNNATNNNPFVNVLTWYNTRLTQHNNQHLLDTTIILCMWHIKAAVIWQDKVKEST